MIRVIYLLSIRDLNERKRLIEATLSGKRWTVRSTKGKMRKLTDREMVDLSEHLHGWTRSVYEFGCAYIHLSDYHNHATRNPFNKLPPAERAHILKHLRYYHGGPRSDSPSMEELASYLLRVFHKIHSNLECYLKDLEADKAMEL